jgi:hypothetical protein
MLPWIISLLVAGASCVALSPSALARSTELGDEQRGSCSQHGGLSETKH